MKGKIFIKGEIGGEGVNLIDVVTQVKDQEKASSFDVIIDSQGGNLQTGFEIYDYLKTIEAPVNTIGKNIVASIATVIFMAGQKRSVQKGTEFMIHMPFLPFVENAGKEDLEYLAKEVGRVENKLIDFYSDNLNLDKNAIKPILKNETWLSENQMQALGIVTEPINNRMPVIANFNIKNPKKMNKKEEKTTGAAKSIVKMIANFLAGEVSAKLLYTADDREVNFAELDEDAEVSVGDVATIDGETAEGSVVMADGNTVVFEGGAVVEIIAKEETTEEVIEDKTELENALQELEDAVKKVETLEAEKNQLEVELVAQTKKTSDANNMLKKIQEIQSKIVGKQEKRNVEVPQKKQTLSQRREAAFASIKNNN